MKHAIIAAVLALNLGCATITTSSNFHGVESEYGETPIETVMIENTGWTAFKVIPIASGDPQRPNKNTCRLFKDTTTLQNNLNMLDMEMKRVGASRIANLSSRTEDESLFLLLFTRTACRTSAVLLK